MKVILNLIFIFSLFQLSAQNRITDLQNIRTLPNDSSLVKKDSLKKDLPKLPASDYKIFNVLNDTISVDTTLSIRDAYRFNQFFKDDFDKIAFQNIGQPATALTFNEINESLLPGFVASTKLTDYWTHAEVPFFSSPTPYSDLWYINGIGQGQMANGTFATNIKRGLNIAAGYRGLNSLGLYKRSISSSGRFFGSLNYNSKNERHKLKLYYFTYEKTNEENGGIKTPEQFENGGTTFSERSRIDVNLSDAKNQFKNHRLFLGNDYEIVKNKLIAFQQSIYDHHIYHYQQNQISSIIGESTQTTGAFKDSVYLKRLENLAGLKFKVKHFDIESGLAHIYQFYAFDSLKILNGHTYPKFLEYQDVLLKNKAQTNFGNFELQGQLDVALTKNLAGYVFKAGIKYQLPKDFILKGQISSLSKRPDFKYLLYQSAYDKYNWYHPEFDNELTQKLVAEINHKKYGKLSAKQIMVNNFIYFGLDSLPHQDQVGVKYAAFKYSNDFKYKKWGFSTDLQWQKVLDGQDLLSLPSYILRGSLYYSNYYFQHNLYVQTGINAKYFEPFYAKAYNPVIAEFNLQNQQKIGGYPIVDYFINFKIKRFKFYFKLEHLNALLNKNQPDYYAAPLQPYRDFTIRFGLRWIFFN